LLKHNRKEQILYFAKETGFSFLVFFKLINLDGYVPEDYNCNNVYMKIIPLLERNTNET